VDAQDLAYALNQIVHNFGAVAVTAGAASGRWMPASGSSPIQRRMAWLTLAGWAAQAASGATFGAISYLTYGRLPDIHGIALGALCLKIACAVVGFCLCAVYLVRHRIWGDARHRITWMTLLTCAVLALGAAAFLRWFS
jgi:hypothetical protein